MEKKTVAFSCELNVFKCKGLGKIDLLNWIIKLGNTYEEQLYFEDVVISKCDYEKSHSIILNMGKVVPSTYSDLTVGRGQNFQLTVLTLNWSTANHLYKSRLPD